MSIRSTWACACVALATTAGVLGPAAAARAATPLTVTDCNSDAQLQADVAQANADNDGDTITFACSGDIQLSKTIAISGSMTLDATGQSVTLDGHDEYQVAAIDGSGPTTVALTGLTIANGSEGSGDDTIIEDQTEGDPYTAGGVFNENGSLTVSHCTFTDNSVNQALPPAGGAITSAGLLNVSDSTFTGNQALTGGAIYMEGSDSPGETISGSSFTDNAAVQSLAPFLGGGAIQIDLNFVTITDSSITGNNSQGSGGGIGLLEAGGTISDTTIADNSTSTDSGGAIQDEGIDPEVLSIVNSTIAGNNSATGGAALFNAAGDVRISASTIALNGGQDGLDSVGGRLEVDTSILDDSVGPNCAGTITDGNNNLDSGSTCGLIAGGDLQNTNPALDPSGLHDNGGPTQTIALESASPAIDVVPAADCQATDQRGYPRPAAGEVDCDMGAYEAGSSLPASADLGVTLAGPSSAGDNTTFTETLTVSNAGPSPAANVASSMSIPSGVSVKSSGGGKIHGTGTRRLDEWTNRSLAAGASVSYSVTFRVDSRTNTRVKIRGASNSAVKDPNPIDNTAVSPMKLG